MYLEALSEVIRAEAERANANVLKAASSLDLPSTISDIMEGFDARRVFYDAASGYDCKGDPIKFAHGSDYNVLVDRSTLMIHSRHGVLLEIKGEGANALYSELSDRLENERKQHPQF